ncbi:hypothetical protein SETIT_2G103500v2 [Setaria italica]|uniref:Uncharacterized protein n=1 Tax=Setaria italica TaxID=4555 RepID=A0A368PX12_SETIT|nr:hypothetical protein SETIT_2G103500v2 [Setaria italica]
MEPLPRHMHWRGAAGGPTSGVQAEVKQSRHPKTAGRAFYVCKWTFDPMPVAPCDFFQWIDGPNKYDPRIHLFPYHSTELQPYHQFRMYEEEKQEAAWRCVRDPPMCKCGVAAKLMHPNLGVPLKFTPFFRCLLKTHDGWPLCDFNEYIYGPKAMWPTEEQVQDFESGKAPWPCVSSPNRRCKCGILATKGVVHSELGYGSFCDNAHGEYWLASILEPWKSRQIQELIEKIRKEYDAPIPDSDFLWGKIYQDMIRERKRRIEMEELQENAEEAQMEAMKALVADLLVGKVNVDKKGKVVVIAGDDDDDDDELLCEGDSD